MAGNNRWPWVAPVVNPLRATANMKERPPLSLCGTSPPNSHAKVEIIMSNPYCVFGGEPIESPDGESFEGVGETRLTTGTIFTDKLFTGQREITGLGIYHYGARFYSPKLGRFISPDSIVPNQFNPQDLNRFSYVVNNPLRYTDPTGHMYSCDGDCGRIGTPDHVFERFIDSPFAWYYTQLSHVERSIHKYHSNPSNANKIFMEVHIGQARTDKLLALQSVPSDKTTEAMYVFPDILGGGYVEQEVDLGSDFGFGGSSVDPGATPILPNGQPQTPTLTSTPPRRPAPTGTPTPTSTPPQTYRPTSVPRRHGGEIMD